MYPAAFEAAWVATSKTGMKLKAFKAWDRAGRPSADLVGASWSAWMLTDDWQRGFIPHVATWLNGRAFEQEPVNVVRGTNVGARPPRESFEEAERRRERERQARKNADSAAAAKALAAIRESERKALGR